VTQLFPQSDLSSGRQASAPISALTGLEQPETISVADPNLHSNVAWMLAGTMWQGLCQWTLVVVLAKVGTVEMVGTFTLGLAIALPVLMFSSLSLRSIQVTDCTRSYRFLEFLAVRLLTTMVSLVLIAAFVIGVHYTAVVIASTILISTAKGAEHVSDIFYGLLQREERMAGIALSAILRGTLQLGALGAGIWFTGSLVWGAAGLFGASLVTLLLFDIPRGLAFRNRKLSTGLRDCAAFAATLLHRGARKRLALLALTGLPLGGVLMLVSLNLNLPRYFIEHQLGTRELGIFSSIANLMAGGNLVISALGQGVTPRLSKHFQEFEMRAFRSLVSIISLTSLGIGIAGFLAALLFGRQLLSIIYRPEYATQQEILVWLMAASGFFYMGSALGCAVTAVKCFTPQLPLFATAAAATAIASMAFVHSMGLRGAALAILISGVIQCVGGAGLLRNAWRRAHQPS
jgi:O-antigen/teichoic acid export membrane protein